MKLESVIQSDIIKRLKKRKKSFTYKHPPVPTGIPDIFHLEKGVEFRFEVKRTEADKPTPIQLYQHKKLRKAGAKVFVVWSWDQVNKILTDYFKT